MLYLKLHGTIEEKHRQLAGWMVNIELGMHLFDRGEYVGNTRSIRYGSMSIKPQIGAVITCGFNLDQNLLASSLNEASFRCIEYYDKYEVILPISSVGAIAKCKNVGVTTSFDVNYHFNDAFRYIGMVNSFSKHPRAPFTWNIHNFNDSLKTYDDRFFLKNTQIHAKSLGFTSTILVDETDLINLPSPTLRLELPKLSEFNIPLMKRPLLLNIHMGVEYHVLNVLTGVIPSKKPAHEGPDYQPNSRTLVYVGPCLDDTALQDLKNEPCLSFTKNMLYLISSLRDRARLTRNCRSYKECTRCFITGVPLFGVVLMATVKVDMEGMPNCTIKVMCSLIAPLGPFILGEDGELLSDPDEYQGKKITLTVMETRYVNGPSFIDFIQQMPISDEPSKGHLTELEKQVLLAILSCGLRYRKKPARIDVFMTLQLNPFRPCLGIFDDQLDLGFLNHALKIGAIVFEVKILHF